MSATNKAVLSAVWKDCYVHNVPVVISGGFNMGPSSLHPRVPEQLGCVIRAAEEPTDVGSSSSVLDYFLVGRLIDFAAPVVSVDVRAPFSPHGPVTQSRSR
eukprot:2206592-Pyramimonas_sp.AAC.1